MSPPPIRSCSSHMRISGCAYACVYVQHIGMARSLGLWMNYCKTFEDCVSVDRKSEGMFLSALLRSPISCISDCHLGWRTLVLKCNKNNYDCISDACVRVRMRSTLINADIIRKHSTPSNMFDQSCILTLHDMHSVSWQLGAIAMCRPMYLHSVIW